MSKAWMPFYVADYLADTLDLETEEHGAYLLLMFHYWQHGGLPADEKRLQKIAKLSAHKWKKIWPIISRYFGENFSHKRIDRELSKSAEISEKRAAAAKAKHEKASANAGANAEQVHPSARVRAYVPQSQSQSQKKERKGEGPDETPSDDEPPLTKPPPERAPLTIDEIRHQTVLKVQGLRFAPRASVAGMVRDFVDHGADPSALMRVAGECSISNLSIDDFKTKAAQLLPGEIRTAITSNEEASHAQRASHSGRQSVTSAAEAAKRSFGGT